jgi:hypothetical protein
MSQKTEIKERRKRKEKTKDDNVIDAFVGRQYKRRSNK